MKLEEAIEQALEKNTHVTRKNWRDSSVSPAFLQAILNGDLSGIEITKPEKNDKEWEINKK